MTSRTQWLNFGAIVACLVIAFAFGGGGSRFGLANLTVQLSALLALAICQQPAWRFWKEAPATVRGLVAASLLLPLLQLVPLPQALWSALPRRDMIADSLDLAGAQGAGSLSLYPLRTALAASALATPLAVLMIGWTLPRRQLFNLGWLVVAMGLMTLAIGAVQLSSEGAQLEFWPEGLTRDVLLGTFANRNTTGIFLVGALGFALLLPPPRPITISALVLMRGALAALILTAIILTKSRTALVLAAIPLTVGLLHMAFVLSQSSRRVSTRRSGLIALAVIAIGAAGLGGAVLSSPGRLAETIDRFDHVGDDYRRFFWEDASYAASRYWPVGAGMGTFEEVFQVDEAIENISGRRAGRAHNDYLEIAIEAGAAGLLLIALWIIMLAWWTWRARTSQDRWSAWAASCFLLAIALQSITDYPLRTQTMLAMAAMALVLLVRLGSSHREERA